MKTRSVSKSEKSEINKKHFKTSFRDSAKNRVCSPREHARLAVWIARRSSGLCLGRHV